MDRAQPSGDQPTIKPHIKTKCEKMAGPCRSNACDTVSRQDPRSVLIMCENQILGSRPLFTFDLFMSSGARWAMFAEPDINCIRSP